MSTHSADLRRLSWPQFPHVEAAINALVDAVRRQRPISSPTVKANITQAGTSYQATPPRSSSVTRLPFETYASEALKVRVAGGRITWHDQDLDIANLTDLDYASEITVPANSTAFKVWLDLVDSFAPTAPVIASGTSGWTSYPDQPFPPARRYLLLAEIASDSTAITGVTLRWNGGDVPWQGPFGFWA